MSLSQIPPANYGGRPSEYRPIIENLKIGEFASFDSESKQIACYNCARRLGKSVAMRKIGNDFRIYRTPAKKVKVSK